MIDKKKRCKTSYFYYFLAILLGWFPSFLGLYPGLFTYDSIGQYVMVRDNSVTLHHPLIHTLLLGGLTNYAHKIFGGINKGVLAYTVIQMLIMAACFAYLISFEEKRKTPLWFRIASIAWLCFFPPNVVLVMSCTKDSIFSALVVLFVTVNAELFKDKETFLSSKRSMILWIVATFFTTIMRNNAIYAMALFFLVFFVVLRKEWKKVLVMVGVTVLLFVLYEGSFCSLFAKESVSKKEMLSVPCQQVIRVYKYHYDELDASERDEIEGLFGWVAFEYYNPKIADATKANIDIEKLDANKNYYIKEYLKLGAKYPGEYIKAFGYLTLDYWYPFDRMVLDINGTEGYLSVENHEPAESNPIIPAIYDYYRIFANSPVVQEYPLTKLIFSPALYFYILLITTVILSVKKKRNEVVPLVFVWLLWLSFLLGPVVLVRYAIYLYYLLPLEIVLLTEDKLGKKLNKIVS